MITMRGGSGEKGKKGREVELWGNFSFAYTFPNISHNCFCNKIVFNRTISSSFLRCLRCPTNQPTTTTKGLLVDVLVPSA